MIASATAPWWYLILAFLAAVGIVGFVMHEIIIGFMKLLRFLLKPVTYFLPTQINVEIDERDPTRPRFMEDENAAWVNVTRKMEQFERKVIEGRKK